MPLRLVRIRHTFLGHQWEHDCCVQDFASDHDGIVRFCLEGCRGCPRIRIVYGPIRHKFVRKSFSKP